MPSKRVSVYLNDEDLRQLDEFCKSHACSQSAALKSLFYRSKNAPAAPAPANPSTSTVAAPEVHEGEWKFHLGVIDQEEKAKKEEREKRLAKARADADTYINSPFEGHAPDFLTKMVREANVRDRIRKEIGEM